MPPKGTKQAMKRGPSRGASRGRPSKKTSTEDVKKKATIICETLAEAEQIPKPVRMMLMKMVGHSLETCQDARHEFQAQATIMIGEALASLEKSIEDSLHQAQEKLDGAEQEKATREEALTVATARLDALKVVVTEKQEALKSAEEAQALGQKERDLAEKAVKDLAPETRDAKRNLTDATKRLDSLRTGALAAFGELKARTTPEEEPE